MNHLQLLETILIKLDLHDRLVCKRVCQRWHKLLMERPIFHADRHIYLKNCLILPDQPPMSVFMAAKYPYEALTFEGDFYYNKRPDVIKFAQHLGKSVKEVTFRKFVPWDIDPCLIVREMSSIETLSIKEGKLSDVFRVTDYVSSKMSHFLHNLKTLKVHQASAWSVQNILRFLSKDAEIFIDCLEVNDENHSIECLTQMMEAAQVNTLFFEAVNGSKADIIELLLELKSLSCQHIKIFDFQQQNKDIERLCTEIAIENNETCRVWAPLCNPD